MTGIASNVPDEDKLPSTLPILKEALLEKNSKERGGIHVSDVIGCIRKSVWQKLVPVLPTDKDLNNFTSGKGIDGALEDLTYIKRERFRAKPELWISIETGEPIFWYDAGPDDICAHPDIWDKELNIPIEGKSNKTENIWIEKFNTLEEAPPTSNVKQLLAYMAMGNKSYGRLLIQYMNYKKGSAWREIDYHRTPEELKVIRQELAANARLYKKSLDAKDVSLASHVMDKGKDENYLCKICPYYKECLEINKRKG